MSDSHEEGIRSELRDELARVNKSIVAIKKEPRAEELEGFGDNTPLSEEIDSISVAEQNEIQADHLGRLFDRAAALDEAIHRLDRGVYGLCVSCGAKIPEQRLKVVPEAARCTDCQSDVERRKPKDEPLPAEWKSVKELYEAREAFDEEGFERHPEHVEDMTGFTKEGE